MSTSPFKKPPIRSPGKRVFSSKSAEKRKGFACPTQELLRSARGVGPTSGKWLVVRSLARCVSATGVPRTCRMRGRHAWPSVSRVHQRGVLSMTRACPSVTRVWLSVLLRKQRSVNPSRFICYSEYWTRSRGILNEGAKEAVTAFTLTLPPDMPRHTVFSNFPACLATSSASWRKLQKTMPGHVRCGCNRMSSRHFCTGAVQNDFHCVWLLSGGTWTT